MCVSKMTKAEAGMLGSLKRSENFRKRYDENPKKCKHCGKVIPYEFRHTKVFCNSSCSAIFNNKLRGWRVEKNKCENCGKECDKTFCCRKCQVDSRYKKQIVKWKENTLDGITGVTGSIKNFLRRYLFEKHNGKCALCGWDKKNPVTGKCPLEVEHIDGNHENNKEENLTLLCPNCHSLTSTYKSLNRGKGRSKRMIRYRQGKTF